MGSMLVSKKLDKEVFGPLGAKSFTEPLEALCMMESGVAPSGKDYAYGRISSTDLKRAL